VLDKLTAPVTPRVVPNVAAPVKLIVANVAVLVTFTVDKVANPDTLIVEENVCAAEKTIGPATV
jgi:hypothetical protein